MNRIKELRNERNLSLRDFADIIKIPRSTISLYELGSRDIKFDSLKLLCDYFQVTSDYLLGFSIEGILIDYKDTIYMLDNLKYIEYKNKGFIIFLNDRRIINPDVNININFIHGKIPLIELHKANE